MWVNRYKHFRFNGRTAWITFVYVAVVPSIVGVMAYRTDVSLKRFSNLYFFFLFSREKSSGRPLGFNATSVR